MFTQHSVSGITPKLLPVSRLCSSLLLSSVGLYVHSSLSIFLLTDIWNVSSVGVSHIFGTVSIQNLVFHHCGSFFCRISSLFLLLDSHHSTAAVVFLNLIRFLKPVVKTANKPGEACLKQNTSKMSETHPRAIPSSFVVVVVVKGTASSPVPTFVCSTGSTCFYHIPSRGCIHNQWEDLSRRSHYFIFKIITPYFSTSEKLFFLLLKGLTNLVPFDPESN